ncbi:unnamed protein product [Kluyveromyces dobzhanskii CBS 2104]|uniref:Succinate dehydrogenase assembly factor 2, mitochondrial n=1 Tax=Kluyveromyces dobzhanskii CBS 2104 TaxID=1427455 RepID=A0A0A8L3B4_9SACH|nr:unnamed protein product [Kluyveromyces dobzhanskii CBS 2104]
MLRIIFSKPSLLRYGASSITKHRSFHTSLCQLNEAKDDVTMRIRIAPIKRTGESLDNKRARLVYQSRKRGILETDLLLSRFAAKYLKEMTPEQLEEYDQLLNELDWDIYYWATENYAITPLPDRWKNSELLKQLQEFSKNKDREILSMPDLSKY